MFNDAAVEHNGRLITGRPDRIIRRIHDDRDASDDLVDRDMVSHPAGTARKDKLILAFKPLQGDAQRMHGETLLYEGPAVKYLRHDNPPYSVTRMACIKRRRGTPIRGEAMV